MHASIIRNGQIQYDDWVHESNVDRTGLDGERPERTGQDLVVSLESWISERDVLRARPGRVAVRLEPEDDPRRLNGDLDRLSMVQITFHEVKDGRGYSQARLLRERLSFQGELRAVGSISPDRAAFMLQCGIDSLEVGADVDPGELMDALSGELPSYLWGLS